MREFWTDVMLTAGCVAAGCGALAGVAVAPHPYDKVVIGLGAAAGAVCAYLKQSPLRKDTDGS